MAFTHPFGNVSLNKLFRQTGVYHIQGDFKFIPTVAVYSIKDLENLSGIKAHTLRIWESRYNIVKPRRTATNIRYYEDEDLKLLLNIALLNKNGYKISKISKMSPAEMTQKVAEISDIKTAEEVMTDALTLSLVDMNEYAFDRIVTKNIQQVGFERTMLEVIYPFLDKVSLLWLTGSILPIQENLINQLIRQKIVGAIDRLKVDNPMDAKRFMLFLPEGETQEISMLLFMYLIKSRGFYPVFLGKNVSREDIKEALSVRTADYVLTMVSDTYTRKPLQSFVDSLLTVLPNTHLLISGYQTEIQDVAPAPNVTVLQSIQSVIDFLEGLK